MSLEINGSHKIFKNIIHNNYGTTSYRVVKLLVFIYRIFERNKLNGFFMYNEINK